MEFQIVCPDCKEQLEKSNNSLQCTACGQTFSIINGKPIFRPFCDDEWDETNKGDWLDRIKSIFKKWPHLYQFLVLVVSPVAPNVYRSYQDIYRYLQKDQHYILINAGAGPNSIGSEFINFDYYPYPSVDVVGDIHHLPFPDESCNAVVNIVLLEHVLDPYRAVEEMYRVLKPGGIIYSVAPFIVGFHAAPADFHRWTLPGLVDLHHMFEECESGVFGGPTSSFLWVFEEWLAIIFSFGIVPLYKALTLLFMFISWPIKYLDILLVKHPMASNIGSSFYFIGKKREKK